MSCIFPGGSSRCRRRTSSLSRWSTRRISVAITRAVEELTQGERRLARAARHRRRAHALPRDAQPPAWTRLQGPNQWPGALPELQPAPRTGSRNVTDLDIRAAPGFRPRARAGQTRFDLDLPRARRTISSRSSATPAATHTGERPGRRRAQGRGFLTLLLQDEEQGAAGGFRRGSWIDAAPFARHLRRQHRRTPRIRLEWLPARHGAPRRHATAGHRSAFGRRSSSARPRRGRSLSSISPTRSEGARQVASRPRSAQSAVPQCLAATS